MRGQQIVCMNRERATSLSTRLCSPRGMHAVLYTRVSILHASTRTTQACIPIRSYQKETFHKQRVGTFKFGQAKNKNSSNFVFKNYVLYYFIIKINIETKHMDHREEKVVQHRLCSASIKMNKYINKCTEGKG